VGVYSFPASGHLHDREQAQRLRDLRQRICRYGERYEPGVGGQQQAWQFIQDPTGSGYYFIQNIASGFVLDIEENSTEPGAALDAYPMKLTDNDNQLWEAVGGTFPAAVQVVPPAGTMGSSNQYVLYGGSDPDNAIPIENLIVTIYLTEPLIATGSLGFQLNDTGTIALADLAPILAFRLCIVGAANGEHPNIEGAGTIMYASTTPLSVATSVPSNTAVSWTTGEKSNSTYGPITSLADQDLYEGTEDQTVLTQYRLIHSFGHS
jgi:hypothetical protein